MRYGWLMFILLVNTSVRAEDQNLSPLPPPSLSEAKPVVKPKLKKVSKNQTPKKPTSPFGQNFLSVGVGYLPGNMYFGGEKTPADFAYVSLDWIQASDSWHDFGLTLGYLFNDSAVESYNLSVYLGGKITSGPWNFRLGPQVGLAIYYEETRIQQAVAMGLHLGLKGQVDYQFNNWFVAGSVNYHHDIFADSYWGEDPFGDVVLDFLGPQLSIGYSF